jgi:hypothetical protein
MKHQWVNDESAFGMPDLTYCSACNAVLFINTKDDECPATKAEDTNDIVYRLKKRAEIRRSIKDRKSVREGRPDRIADLLEEAAETIESMRKNLTNNPK